MIEKYHFGEYDTNTFADEFDMIYCHEGNEADLLKEEDNLFAELSKIAGRYSPFEEDHQKYPGVYYTDEDVKTKAEEVFWQTRKFRE